MLANRPAPLMAVLAILSVACVGESGSVVEGSPTADLAVAVPADGSELPASAGAWMDAEPDVTATQGDAEPTVPLASAGSVTTNVRESGHVPDAPTDEATVVRTFPAPTATTEEGAPVARLILPEEPLVFTRPEAVRGIYLNG